MVTDPSSEIVFRAGWRLGFGEDGVESVSSLRSSVLASSSDLICETVFVLFCFLGSRRGEDQDDFASDMLVFVVVVVVPSSPRFLFLETGGVDIISSISTVTSSFTMTSPSCLMIPFLPESPFSWPLA